MSFASRLFTKGSGSRHTSRGESSRRPSRSDSRHDTLQEKINSAGFGHVRFRDKEQREVFVALMDRPMSATRFIDQDALESLGLRREMKRMLKKTGCPGLYTMCEHTYRCLTLEFLSSYYYDEEEPAVNFRLFNSENCLYPEEWGRVLGCRSVGVTSPSHPRDGTDILWQALTGLQRGGAGWKFRAHLIQHPVIRIWCRLVSNAYFGRPESTNMKIHEVHMLFSYLNVDGGEPFKVNVAHFVAKHLELVAAGEIHPIMVGGLITHLAKSIYEPFDESTLDKVPGAPTGEPLTLNIITMARMHYLKTINSQSWWWKWNNSQLLRLPEEGPELLAKPVVPQPLTPNGNLDLSYYLLQATDQDLSGDDDDAAPPVSFNLIDPMGDYSRYQHYPFQQGPYRPEGCDPQRFPPTFATYPPFAEPRIWNQNSRDSMMMGLCNQMHQVNLHRSIADHNIYAYHDRQGHFPEGTVHPAFYVPQPDPHDYSEGQGTNRSNMAAEDSDEEDDEDSASMAAESEAVADPEEDIELIVADSEEEEEEESDDDSPHF